MSVYVGIGLAMTASAMNATGMNLQRYGANIEKNATQRKDKTWGKRINILGVVLSIACGIVDFISYGFAPQSTLAPFGSMSLIVNLILAPLLHGETLEHIDLISTALVMVGLVTCITSGSKVPLLLESMSELSALILRPICILYFLALVFFVLSGMVHIYLEERAGNGARKSVGIFYPLIAGTFASSTALTAKVMSQVIKLKGNILLIILCVLGVVFFAVSNMTVNNRGLSNHSPLFIVPVFSTTFLATNIIGGGVFFNEFSTFTPKQW